MYIYNEGFHLFIFGYCPLLSMFHSRRLNSRISNIHKRALRIVHKDCIKYPGELPKKKYKSVTIHQRNL